MKINDKENRQSLGNIDPAESLHCAASKAGFPNRGQN
jgi:hypothetical protein